MSNSNIMTLTDAGALYEILSAVRRKARVGRLDSAGEFVITGTAQYIGRMDHQADDGQDVRDLFLFVRLAGGTETGVPWLIRTLIREYRAHTFITDFDVAAFEAAGGQAAVPASVAEYRRATAHKAQPQPGAVWDREDDPVTRGVLPAAFPLYGECRVCGEPVRCYDITADWGHDSEFGAPYRFIHPVTPAERYLMRQARGWIADCFDTEALGGRDVGDLDDGEVYGGVAAHFEGGWAAYMRAEFAAPACYPAMAFVYGTYGAADALADAILVLDADGWCDLALSLAAGQEVRES